VKEVRSFKVEDSTQIKDTATFLASNATKDSLALYLAQQLIDNSTMNIVTVTRKSVMVNYDCNVATNVSTQEGADTLMILHAAEIAASGTLSTSTHRTYMFFSWLTVVEYHNLAEMLHSS